MNELCQKVAKHMQMEELVKLRHQTWVEQVGERKNANKEGKKRNRDSSKERGSPRPTYSNTQPWTPITNKFSKRRLARKSCEHLKGIYSPKG